MIESAPSYRHHLAIKFERQLLGKGQELLVILCPTHGDGQNRQ